MSTKPPKKSDLGKSWMAPRRDSRRQIQPEYHLIVTEGTDTEPEYFNAIKKIINEKYREHIQLEVAGQGDNTVNLFYIAKDLADHSLNGYRHVWVVYDTDDFPHEHINRVAELCKSESTDERIFHAIWSNQCVELWFLLHFSYMQSDIHRQEYWPKLSECLRVLGAGEYRKNRSDMYVTLRPYMDVAIKNAKKLAAHNAGKTPADSAPGTMVYEMIEMFRPYL